MHDDEAKESDQREAGHHAEFLAGDGEDEVGMGVGQDALVDAFPRPVAEPSARQYALQRGVDLERVDDAADGIGIEEAQHALVHVRRQLEGGEAADHADAAEAETQNQCRPAMKNKAAQTTETSMVWPKSGSRISGTMVSGSSSNGNPLANERRRAHWPPSAKAQAPITTNAGLTNSDGCTPTIQRREPLTSTPNISASTTSAIADTNMISAV